MKHLTGIRRFLLLGVLYSIGLSFSLYLAYLIRFDFNINKVYLQEYFANLIWVLPVKLTFLTIFGQFQGMLSFFSIPDLRRLTFACVAASIFIYIIWILTAALSAPPRGVLLADFTITLMGLSATRIALRQFRNSVKNFNKRAFPLKPVAIVGAGDVGATLVKDLLTKTNLGLLPVAYFDDNQNKKNFSIHGVPDLGIPELIPQFAEELRIQEAIIAMPSASVKRLSQIVKLLQEAGLKFETVPSLNQLATGRVKVSNIRPVEIQDLLGREAIRLESQTIQHLVNGKVTLVSGAGGSIGSELCRQIRKFKPSKLILLDRSEVQIFLIEQELKHMEQDQCIIPIICDILDENRIKSVLNRFRPKIVFHAAAHKHVSLMEEQPGEAIKNNACGTARFANAALDAAVDRFILISTDKAINPTSVMGASKRLAEMYLQALNNENNDRTRFMAVRFGNVLDSSGSVIPIF